MGGWTIIHDHEIRIILVFCKISAKSLKLLLQNKHICVVYTENFVLSRSASVLYSEGLPIVISNGESAGLICFLIFLSYSRQMARCYMKLVHNHAFPRPFQFVIH
jgi:hypothetical protein